ncbi:hypothetical protein Btru_046828 [Bulinus truncatus]|nr:hypothetical protein Btru_046828 [Bulinus truncatus]
MERLARAVFWAVFICFVSSQTVNDCPSSVPRDNHLRVFGDSCFQFVINRQRTHTLARRDCETHGGTLALVKSQTIQDFLYHTLTNDYRDFYDKLWIGLNDIDKEDEFKWEDGTPLSYSNWDGGEGPSSTSWSHSWNHDENDCVVLDVESNGKWGEYPCDESTFLIFFSEDEEHSYVCQYRLASVSNDTTTTIEVVTTVDTVTPVSGQTDTTVSILTNPCPAFSCDLDCGMDGFKKNETSGCSQCECAA